MTATYTTVNGMLMHEDRGGVETFYTPDPLGNLIETRNSSGTKTYSAQYWPYGELQTSTGTNPSPWGFVGLLGYLADSLTMMYVRARYLMSKFGRWLTVDRYYPFLKAYGYSVDSPAMMTDSSGNDPGGDGKTGCKVFKCHNRGPLSHACVSVVGPNGGCTASSYMEGMAHCPGAEKNPSIWDCTLVSTDCSLAGEVCGCIARAYKGGGWTGFWGQGMCWGSAISYICCGCQNLPHRSEECLSDNCPPIFCPPPKCGPSRGSGGAGSLPII